MITIADIFCKRQLDIINKQSLFAPENYRGEKKKRIKTFSKTMPRAQKSKVLSYRTCTHLPGEKNKKINLPFVKAT